MREIKPQSVGRYQRTGLLHVRTQHLSQSSVKEMSTGVVGLDTPAALGVYAGGDAIANSKLTLLNPGFVNVKPVHYRVGILDFGEDVLAFKNADIADLATGFRVE